jgi:hypothetical protein
MNCRHDLEHELNEWQAADGRNVINVAGERLIVSRGQKGKRQKVVPMLFN